MASLPHLFWPFARSFLPVSSPESSSTHSISIKSTLNGRACRKLSSEFLTHGFDRRLLNVSARYVFRSPDLWLSHLLTGHYRAYSCWRQMWGPKCSPGLRWSSQHWPSVALLIAELARHNYRGATDKSSREPNMSSRRIHEHPRRRLFVMVLSEHCSLLHRPSLLPHRFPASSIGGLSRGMPSLMEAQVVSNPHTLYVSNFFSIDGATSTTLQSQLLNQSPVINAIPSI